MVCSQVVRHEVVTLNTAGSNPARSAVSVTDAVAPPKRIHQGSTPCETTPPSSNGRAAALQAADGGSIPPGGTSSPLPAG